MRTLEILNMLHDGARQLSRHYTTDRGDESTGIRYYPGFPGQYKMSMYYGTPYSLGTGDGVYDRLSHFISFPGLPEKVTKTKLKKIIKNFYSNN